VKLFQIEEPDGSPADPDAPGAAIGIDLCGPRAEVAIAVGGNAGLLEDRDGFEVDLTMPSPTAAIPEWQALFERARLRAERALARPVTHAVVVAAASLAERLQPAAAAAQLTLLRIATPDKIAGESPALAAAILAEELVPPVAGP
jgi:hypothetical protein